MIAGKIASDGPIGRRNEPTPSFLLGFQRGAHFPWDHRPEFRRLLRDPVDLSTARDSVWAVARDWVKKVEEGFGDDVDFGDFWPGFIASGVQVRFERAQGAADGTRFAETGSEADIRRFLAVTTDCDDVRSALLERMTGWMKKIEAQYDGMLRRDCYWDRFRHMVARVQGRRRALP